MEVVNMIIGKDKHNKDENQCNSTFYFLAFDSKHTFKWKCIIEIVFILSAWYFLMFFLILAIFI